MPVATELKRREFLQLAHTYKPEKPPKGGWNLGGYLSSEKLDGGRCFWDGGLSRGMNTVDVPWASVTDPKTGGRKKKIKPKATGLWSRYGNPIMAPDFFLNGLPTFPLDGELTAGRGRFQYTMSVIRKDNPVENEWSDIQFAVYGSPPLSAIFGDGEIKNANFHCALRWDAIRPWVQQRAKKLGGHFRECGNGDTFAQELMVIKDVLETQTDFAYLHRQVVLPSNHQLALDEIERQLETVLDAGGEGLILRAPQGLWVPKRMKYILKYKPYLDSEATITGFTSGRIGKTGQRKGLIGAMITDYKGKRLEVAGFNFKELEFAKDLMIQHAANHPGEDMPSDFQGLHFKVGDTLTFRYRELSDDGIPKDARYLRSAN